MLNINSLKFNENATVLHVDVTRYFLTGEPLDNGLKVSLIYYTESVTNTIDLSPFFTDNTLSHIVDIPLSSLLLESFTGIFYLEFVETDATITTGVVANLIPYHIFLLEKISAINIKAGEMLSTEDDDSANVPLYSTLLDGIVIALCTDNFDVANSLMLTLQELMTISSYSIDVNSIYYRDGLNVGTFDGEVLQISNGTTVHNELLGRSREDCHPVEAITGLETRLKAIEDELGLTETTA